MTLGDMPPGRGAEFSALEATNQKIQGAVEDLGHITRGYRVTEQRLGMTEFVVRPPGNRDLHAVQLRFRWCQLIDLAQNMFRC